MMRILYIFMALILMGSLSGCGPKLDMTSSFELPVGGGKILTVEAIKNEQNIKVTGSASGAPVNVYIYLAKNKNAAENELITKRFTTIILNKQDKTESINLEAVIPANEEAVVHINNTGKMANVQLKITNK